MNVPFLDLQQQFCTLEGEIMPAIRGVMTRASYILGPEVAAFEREFADFCGVRECVSVGSGCDALLLAMRAAGIGTGDEVIVPANTFIATALAVTACGATPVFVDCKESDYTLDPESIIGAITPRTKAIVPVHLYGLAVEMKKIMDIAEKYDLLVIEDAAQAHGAKFENNMCGSMGIAGCFSFYPGKNLGAYGDGGAITTNDPVFADKLRMLRNYGQSRKYYHDVAGWNTRLDSIQAVILSIKLKHIKKWNVLRNQHAEVYRKRLADTLLVLPAEYPGRSHVYHLFVVLSDKRDDLLGFLSSRGVCCGMHYPVPVHLQQAYSGLGYKRGAFPRSERIAGNLLSLPIFPEMKNSQIEYVCDCIHDFLK